MHVTWQALLEFATIVNQSKFQTDPPPDRLTNLSAHNTLAGDRRRRAGGATEMLGFVPGALRPNRKRRTYLRSGVCLEAHFSEPRQYATKERCAQDTISINGAARRLGAVLNRVSHIGPQRNRDANSAKSSPRPHRKFESKFQVALGRVFLFYGPIRFNPV